MRLVTMGFLTKDDIKDLKGQCCLVLVGSPDEIRSVAPLLYQDVSLGVFVATREPSKADP
jgi:hypothetical protein